jgi:hypothetical protein
LDSIRERAIAGIDRRLIAVAKAEDAMSLACKTRWLRFNEAGSCSRNISLSFTMPRYVALERSDVLISVRTDFLFPNLLEGLEL